MTEPLLRSRIIRMPDGASHPIALTALATGAIRLSSERVLLAHL
jgi:hypothetical protein